MECHVDDTMCLLTTVSSCVSVMCSGVDAEYDQAISDIQSVEQALRDYLDQQKKVLGCRVNITQQQITIL